MLLITDLHLHSFYSRAVSPQMNIPEMSFQAHRRGIHLLATGDWTHPEWIKHLQVELEEWSDGIYASRKQPEGAKFLLSTEISCIYSQNNRLRRIHVLVCAPNFKTAEEINRQLRDRGANLTADGRPIIGLSCIELCELVFGVTDQAMVIPAHVWTPWFGALGSNGGFDSLAEAFGPFFNRIFAIETGLSSDPLMNWRVPEIDRLAILSFSDAHSPAKMGREATVFKMSDLQENKGSAAFKYTYHDIYQAIAARAQGQNDGILSIDHTLEFYPEEGKYHWDGHRACNVVQTPQTTRENGETCPVCGKRLTIGVENRVEKLAASERLGVLQLVSKTSSEVRRLTHHHDSTRPPFANIVPLQELIAEVLGKGFATKTVLSTYTQLLDRVGDEFSILLSKKKEEIAAVGGDEIAEAVMKMRRGEVSIDPGYDGVYGTVHLQKSEPINQPTLF